MSVTQQALPVGSRLTTVAIRRRARRGGLYGSDRVWAVAFALPYALIFFAFVVYPVAYGLWMGLGANIGAYIWKNLPFWTVILLSGRMAIPQELYEAAAVDGASSLHRLKHVTLPLMANLYVVCVLLDTVFALGDFNATTFVSGGGPAMSTEVLATLGIRYAYTVSLPRLGVAEVM